MEESQEPKEQQPWQIEYKFVNDEFKKDYVLQRIAAAERAHFELMVDRLDDRHSEYPDWMAKDNIRSSEGRQPVHGRHLQS